MPLELSRTSKIRSPYASILLYGPPRWGKTYLIGECAKAGMRPLVISTELGDSGGLSTLADQDIPYIQISNWNDMIRFVAELKRQPGKTRFGDEEFDIVFVDSFSKCGDLWMDAGMTVLKWKGVWDLEPGKDPRRIYSYVAEKGRQSTKMFFALDAHVVLICRESMYEEKIGYDERNNPIVEVYPVPELPGQKLPKELPGDPDAVLYCDKVNGKRRFATSNRGKRVAGIRLPSGITVPDSVEPNLPAIIQLMLGDKSALARLVPVKPSPTRA